MTQMTKWHKPKKKKKKKKKNKKKQKNGRPVFEKKTLQ